MAHDNTDEGSTAVPQEAKREDRDELLKAMQAFFDKQSPSSEDASVAITAPWDLEHFQQCIGRGVRMSPRDIRDFVAKRSRVHEIYILEENKTKRQALLVGAAAVITAALIVTFAPQGREVLSYWLGASLLVVACGAAGYGRVWAKMPGITFTADGDAHAEPSAHSAKGAKPLIKS